MLALVLTVEILSFQPHSQRAELFFKALALTAQAQGIQTARTLTYRGGSEWLMLWGPGHPARFEPMAQQLAQGGHVLAWDLAYWHRERKARVSIDAAHPQAWVLRGDWPADRFIADRVPVADLWNPKGPVIVAGIGEKARVQYGAGVVDRWECDMINACQSRGWTVRYRKKKVSQNAPMAVSLTAANPIEHVLRGASLVVTWHSNVAVDAIRCGIPVVCQDGAAAAVCPRDLPDKPEPLAVDVRDRFLRNLAWFQWEPTRDESRRCWQWLREVVA